MNQEKRTSYSTMAIIAALVGLYLIFIAPGFFDTTMNTLILKQSKQATNLTAGHLSRLYIGSFYSGIEMLVGLALLAVSAALYAGKKWAWSLTMLLLAIPAMVNGYIGLGWLENLKKFPPAYNTFFLSLFAFWIMLFLKDGDKKSKGTMFWIFTLLGMLGAQGFMLFPHAVRVILKNPADALLEPANAVLRRTGPMMFLVVIFAGLAIWKLAQRKESGWYFALLTGLLMAFGAFPAHYARPLVASLAPKGTAAPSVFTSTYWMAGAQGVLLVVLLLIPSIRNALYDQED
jgi:ribose/xylose/arabinose/galactoside ABC-type transport system permease subunit